jgi:hypothetical protein
MSTGIWKILMSSTVNIPAGHVQTILHYGSTWLKISIVRQLLLKVFYNEFQQHLLNGYSIHGKFHLLPYVNKAFYGSTWLKIGNDGQLLVKVCHNKFEENRQTGKISFL